MKKEKEPYGQIWLSRELYDLRRHNEILLPFVQDLLIYVANIAENLLDRVVGMNIRFIARDRDIFWMNFPNST